MRRNINRTNQAPIQAPSTNRGKTLDYILRFSLSPRSFRVCANLHKRSQEWTGLYCRCGPVGRPMCPTHRIPHWGQTPLQQTPTARAKRQSSPTPLDVDSASRVGILGRRTCLANSRNETVVPPTSGMSTIQSEWTHQEVVGNSLSVDDARERSPRVDIDPVAGEEP